MNYQELTPMRVSRYDGYMDPSQATETRTGTAAREVTPAPLSAAARSLLQNAENGSETNAERAEAQSDPMRDMKEKAAKERKKTTRDNLMEVAQTVQNTQSISEVLIDAQFVRAAARMLVHNIEADTAHAEANQQLFDDLKNKKVLENLAELEKFLTSQERDGEVVEEASSSSRNAIILGQAKTVARLAEQVSTYYERAKLSKEYNDPFKQIVSFEELMTQFNITLDDPRFKPGGEFSLLDVEEYTDEYGREVSKEVAHPENFLRWVDERAEFYHDFDPMAAIDLFQGMYIVAGAGRKISFYEMLVDFPAYFATRVQTTGELKVLQSDFGRAAQDPNKFKRLPPKDEVFEVDELGQQVVGYYKNITAIDPDTGKRVTVEQAWVSANAEEDQVRHAAVFPVYYYKKQPDGSVERVPVHAELAAKEQWETAQRSDYGEAQEEILYQLWLMTWNHNSDVNYRQKAMPSESLLKEPLAEIHGDNKMTRTRKRFLKVCNMPATTHRIETVEPEKDENGQQKIDKKTGEPVWRVVYAPSEASDKFKGKLEGQGTLGKAMQRSLAGYYHIAEANAAFEGYLIDGGNPFFEVLKGKNGEKGAEYFYQHIIERNLLEDTKFGYIEDGFNAEKPDTWGKSKVAVEFFNELNSTRIDRGKMIYTDKNGNVTEVDMSGTERKRYEWEKADFVSFMTMGKTDFLAAMKGRNITQASLDAALKELEKRYAVGTPKRQELDAFRASLNEASGTRKRAFAESLVGKAGITQDDLDLQKGQTNAKGKEMSKDGIFYRFLNPKPGDQMQGLDFLAVGMFTKSFPSEYTNDINPYINIRYSLEGRERMRKAMRDTLSYTEKLDKQDALWAEEWAYAMTFWSGISARNDMLGIGHDAWAKMSNTQSYRERQASGGNYAGNLENLYGINRMGADFWEGMKVQIDGHEKYDTSLYQILTGLRKDGDQYIYDINQNMPSFEFPGNAQRQYYADHMTHAIDLYIDVVQKHEFNFDKIVSEDNMGRIIINHGEMQKLIDSTWKHLRYAFDNGGFLYDNMVFAWNQDESLKENGQVSRTPHFGLMSLRDAMFSEEVQAMDMYKRTDVSSWSSGEGKMGRNVFAYLIKAQIEEHTKHSEKATLYSADQVALIADMFISYATRVMRGEHGEPIALSGFFSPEEMYRILTFAHALLWQLYAKEYGEDALGGIIAAIFQTMSIIMKETGAGITLGK